MSPRKATKDPAPATTSVWNGQKKWTSPRKKPVDSPTKKLTAVQSPIKKSPRKTPTRNNHGKPNVTSTPKSLKKLTFDPSSPGLIDFAAFENTPSRSWVEMADEEEALMREILDEKSMEIDIQAMEESHSQTDSQKKKSRKSTPKKTNPNPKFIKSLEMSEPNRKRHMEDVASPSPVVRKRLLRSATNSPSVNLNQTLSPNPREGWEEPKLGWCYCEKTLERRTKEITKAKEKPIYKRYISEVPKMKRVKQVHPKTPNKYINFSRRSWDSQIRSWKKALYALFGEEPSPSCNTSYCGSEADSDSIMGDVPEESQSENSPVKAVKDVNVVLNTPDQMASLLGHFDMDTRHTRTLFADESTLKGNTNSKVNGPVDFSMLKH